MIKKIFLGGGCFWGMQDLFRSLPGIKKTRVGYSGGSILNPTYENHEGHAETIEISYDSDEITYENILDFFFQIHDPTTLNQQGNDIGPSYRSVIFYLNDEDKKQAELFINKVNASGKWLKPVITSLEPFEKFYPAEEYHQDYLQKHPGGYTCHFVRNFGSFIN